MGPGLSFKQVGVEPPSSATTVASSKNLKLFLCTSCRTCVSTNEAHRTCDENEFLQVHCKQGWDGSQAEDDLEEDAMDWLEDDQIMRQREEVSKEEGQVDYVGKIRSNVKECSWYNKCRRRREAKKGERVGGRLFHT